MTELGPFYPDIFKLNYKRQQNPNVICCFGRIISFKFEKNFTHYLQGMVKSLI